MRNADIARTCHSKKTNQVNWGIEHLLESEMNVVQKREWKLVSDNFKKRTFSNKRYTQNCRVIYTLQFWYIFVTRNWPSLEVVRKIKDFMKEMRWNWLRCLEFVLPLYWYALWSTIEHMGSARSRKTWHFVLPLFLKVKVRVFRLLKKSLGIW